jgi:6-phosphogluconate dehydrogenase (decarboxylating)
MVLICKKQYTFEYQKINKLYHNGSYICSFSLNMKLLSIIVILIFDLPIK